MLPALPWVRKEHAFVELGGEIHKEKLEDRHYGSKGDLNYMKGDFDFALSRDSKEVAWVGSKEVQIGKAYSEKYYFLSF